MKQNRLFLFGLLINSILIACGPTPPPKPKEPLPPFAGSWKEVNVRQQEVIYTFEEGGRYSKQTDRNLTRGDYRVEGNSIVLTPRVGKPSTLTDWKLEGDTLSWTIPTGTRIQLQKMETPKTE